MRLLRSFAGLFGSFLTITGTMAAALGLTLGLDAGKVVIVGSIGAIMLGLGLCVWSGNAGGD